MLNQYYVKSEVGRPTGPAFVYQLCSLQGVPLWYASLINNFSSPYHFRSFYRLLRNKSRMFSGTSFKLQTLAVYYILPDIPHTRFPAVISSSSSSSPEEHHVTLSLSTSVCPSSSVSCSLILSFSTESL